MEWEDDVLSLVDLPYEQRKALETAVEQGYYETPHDIKTHELAAHLDIPRSTLQYRLQRAEAWLAKLFADTS
ncbi:helix-turn-helix domain-containing protein [Haladaptatus sp. NG-WS-4]